jgi:hypothetical protein
LGGPEILPTGLSSISAVKLKNIAKDIPPLPLNKTIVEVFADSLAYLFR